MKKCQHCSAENPDSEELCKNCRSPFQPENPLRRNLVAVAVLILLLIISFLIRYYSSDS